MKRALLALAMTACGSTTATLDGGTDAAPRASPPNYGGTIGRANLDGSNVNQSFIVATQPQGYAGPIGVVRR